MTIDPKTGAVPEAMRVRIEQFTPMGRLGGPGETRSAFCFLAAPASSYVTGTIIPVDGGWSAW
jgi:2-deoxy-D-gluconate 3-dehydrogenase